MANPGLGFEVLSHVELRSRLSDAYYSAVHRLDFHQILYVRSGHATAMVDFVDHECAPGTVLHTRPGQVHRLPTTPDGRPADLEAVLLLFTPEFPPPSPHRARNFDPYTARSLQLTGVDLSAIEETIAGIEREYRAFGHDGADVLGHLLSVLLLRMDRLDALSIPSVEAPRIALVRAFRDDLERSFTGRHTVDEYARRLGCSPKTLNRACVEAAGQSAKQIADARTTLEAQRLLAHTDLPVAAIARRLSFTEPTNFGKFFARETGSSPMAFRRSKSF